MPPTLTANKAAAKIVFIRVLPRWCRDAAQRIMMASRHPLQDSYGQENCWGSTLHSTIKPIRSEYSMNVSGYPRSRARQLLLRREKCEHQLVEFGRCIEKHDMARVRKHLGL